METHSVITIGNFDGVHIGHRAILEQARSEATQKSLPVIAVTFDPHPTSILKPGAEPPALMTRAQKIDALTAAGAETVDMLESTQALLDQTPEQFLERLIKKHAPAVVVEGTDFRFGKDRQGDLATLQQLGPRFGFEPISVPQVQVALKDQMLVPVSSSLIRWLLTVGRVADAEACLGGTFTITGRVVAGNKRGRQIGFPTANLDLSDGPGLITPAQGVYAGLAYLPNGDLPPAAISIGSQPTFGGRVPLIEAHLLDFDGDLYDQSITLSFNRWLRDQQRFPSSEALQAQLQRDIELTRQWSTMGLFDAHVDTISATVVR